MYINDQAHRYTGYYASTFLRRDLARFNGATFSFVEVVKAFHVGLRGRRFEVYNDTK